MPSHRGSRLENSRPPVAKRPPRPKAVTFDCYGTLIDWERGIGDAFAAAASRAGRTLEASDVLAAYAAVEPEVEAGPYRPYRDVLTATASRVAQRLGWPLAEKDAGFLAESLPSWQPFPDTNPALTRLTEAGIRLGILSNVDEDLLAGTRRHFTVSFDLVVTAERVRSYKPRHGHFEFARSALGPRAHWLHAAQSYFHDIVPAKALGIPVAWINRKGERAGAAGPPDRELPDLAALADWLTSERPFDAA
jgi:2-haloacid dehalogenase/putative hydrolase of the HAD superfamily